MLMLPTGGGEGDRTVAARREGRGFGSPHCQPGSLLSPDLLLENDVYCYTINKGSKK